MNDVEIQSIDGLFKEISTKRAVLESGPFRFDNKTTLMAAELSLLKVLSGHPGESVTDLASLMNLTKGAVSQTLMKLERKRLIEKQQDSSNASRISIVLSFKGRMVIRKLAERDKRMDYALESQISNLKQKDADLIRTFLEGYNDSLRKRI